jgi:hypothetical protein
MIMASGTAPIPLDTLGFDWPCGFARFEIAVVNPARTEASSTWANLPSSRSSSAIRSGKFLRTSGFAAVVAGLRGNAHGHKIATTA